ncbi:nuclear transport factor 2 family protein [Haliea sp. E17]|uniref:nuclear transport factor 2 family protein n=1 Tax=Haliea sp. E17 TaxID=3401576 RepID=UPI003AAE4F75
MNNDKRQLVADFFRALGRGDDLGPYITDDMSAWIVSSGDADRERFLQGVSFLASIFNGSLTYHIDALTIEDERVAAQVTSTGTLSNGDDFRNDHVFLFRIRDDRVAWLGEFMNQNTVNEKILPLLQAAMSQGA